MKVAIVKYNAGNICSVVNALSRLGAEAIVTDDAEILMSADKIVFPGQGEASTSMEYLRKHNLDSLIKELRQPVLGICIGQQLMCRYSEEGNTYGIGIFPLEVKRFKPKFEYEKVPAMGWNMLHNVKSSLFTGVAEKDFVYFVHSYYVPKCEFTIAESDYILEYSAALHKDNFYATQFHPEKSGKTGEIILRNFLEL